MKELVLDTNVLVSGLLKPENPPGRIVDAIRGSLLGLVVDDRILAEYQTVLRRPWFERYIYPMEREWILDFLHQESRPVLPTQVISNLPDPKDAPFLEIALSARLPLVTGNQKHFPKKKCHGIEVLTPTEYVHKFLT